MYPIPNFNEMKNLYETSGVQKGVYFIFDKKNVLCYIGEANNIRNRINAHRSGGYFQVAKEDIHIVKFINFGDDVLKAEEFYINYYKPKYNGTPFLKYCILIREILENKLEITNCDVRDWLDSYLRNSSIGEHSAVKIINDILIPNNLIPRKNYHDEQYEYFKDRITNDISLNVFKIFYIGYKYGKDDEYEKIFKNVFDDIEYKYHSVDYMDMFL